MKPVRDSEAVGSVDPEGRLAELGIELPPCFPAFGTFVSAVIEGRPLYSAGHVLFDGTSLITGKLGAELNIEQGYLAARMAALSLIATLRHELGDLTKVKRILHLTGTVNATPEFTDHTGVIDGASDLLVEIFGAAGMHARLAVGVNSLPANMALEVQAIVALDID